MRNNMLRGAIALAILLSAAGCKANAPRLPTTPTEPGPEVPPSSGFLAPAETVVYA